MRQKQDLHPVQTARQSYKVALKHCASKKKQLGGTKGFADLPRGLLSDPTPPCRLVCACLLRGHRARSPRCFDRQQGPQNPKAGTGAPAHRRDGHPGASKRSLRGLLGLLEAGSEGPALPTAPRRRPEGRRGRPAPHGGERERRRGGGGEKAAAERG